MPCFTPLQGYKDIHTGGITFKQAGTAQSMQVACGSCLGCRLDHSLMWAIRIVHESYLHLDHEGNCFVTLTYRDPDKCTKQEYLDGYFIPTNYSLRPNDVQKFIRALRKSEATKAEKEKRAINKIRYFYCGEYGDENQRPHYHICLFNHQFNDQTLWKDDEGFYTYTSKELEKLWPWGFSTVQALNFETAAYCAKYSLKKITGEKAKEHYLRCDENGEAFWILPEYIRMSTGRNKPCGLGAGFYEKFTDDIFPSDEIPVPGKGVIRKVPRYYQNILQTNDPAMLEQIKKLRQIFHKAHKADFTPDRLRAKYACARAKQTKRKL